MFHYRWQPFPELRTLRICHFKNSLIQSKTDVYTSKFQSISTNCSQLWNYISHSKVSQNQCVIFSMEHLPSAKIQILLVVIFPQVHNLYSFFTKTSISWSIPGQYTKLISFYSFQNVQYESFFKIRSRNKTCITTFSAYINTSSQTEKVFSSELLFLYFSGRCYQLFNF